MARPTKTGLDYFPFDTKPDMKLSSIIRKYGVSGLGTLIGLYQKIYDNGYYIHVDEDFIEDFCLEFGIDDEDYLKVFIKFSIRKKLFNDFLYKSNKVLTSTGIQKRFLEATKRRKCEHDATFMLIDADGNLVNVSNNSVNDDISTQSKVKKSKGKESKEDKRIKEVLDYLNNKLNKNFRVAKGLLTRFEEGYTVEDCKTVINKKTEEWLGTEYEQYLAPGTLFSEKFDGYLNQTIIKPQVKGQTETISEGGVKRINGMITSVDYSKYEKQDNEQSDLPIPF